MEATAALGLAGNVVQFLDFGQKLTTTIFELWKSSTGLTKSNEDTRSLTEAFIVNLDTVSVDLVKYHAYLQQSHASHQLQEVLNDCLGLAADLIRRINKLRVVGKASKWKSLGVAIKSVWKEKELIELQARFGGFRKELETAVLFSLRVSISSLESQQRSMSDILLELRREEQFEELQSSISRVIEEAIRSQISSLPHWPVPQSRNADTQPPKTIAEAGLPSTSLRRRSFGSEAEVHHNNKDMEPLDLEAGLAQDYATKLAETEQEVLESLSFPVLWDREEAITKAEMATFDWIFRHPLTTDRSWDDFSQWLESGQNIYWINGKAGSGKSTLMKHLVDHKKTVQGLARWTGDTKLLVASFYFWYSGYDLQKTQNGLLRGLLYSCLRDHRELIPMVVPETAGVSKKDLATFWTMPRLRKAFEMLVSQTRFDLKFCFFIDGLDEYAGNHLEIANFVKNMAKHANSKVCVSSRPLAVFDPSFTGFPRLILQNLTFNDISLYVGNRLTDSAMMADLEKEEPGISTELTSQIVTKASGVFLWVRLVVESLLEGLSNCDHGLDLKRRLDDLPPDLEDLYQHMIDRVTPQWYLEEGARLLRMVKASEGHLPLLELCMAEMSVHESCWQALEREALGKDAKNLCAQMCGRLKSRCLGLLEVRTVEAESEYDDPERQVVTFIHKSVYDFLETDVAIARLQRVPGQDAFNPDLALMRGSILELKLLQKHAVLEGNGEINLARNVFTRVARPIICRFIDRTIRFEKHHNRAAVDLVDELEKTADGLWERVQFRSDDERSGLYHWMAAPITLGSATIETGGPLTSDRDPCSKGPNLHWCDITKTPMNKPLDIPSFDALAQLADLWLYTESKGRPPIPSLRFRAPMRLRSEWAPRPTLSRGPFEKEYSSGLRPPLLPANHWQIERAPTDWTMNVDALSSSSSENGSAEFGTEVADPQDAQHTSTNLFRHREHSDAAGSPKVDANGQVAEDETKAHKRASFTWMIRKMFRMKNKASAEQGEC